MNHLNHILAIDIGNTRLKWGLYKCDAGWVKHGSRSTRDTLLPSSLVEEWAEFAPQFEPQSAPHLRAVISNVADVATTKVVISALSAIGCEQIDLITAQAQQCGVRNGYANPAQLGSDRWCALIAAYALMNDASMQSKVAASDDAPTSPTIKQQLKPKLKPQLVIMAGTALTIDALTAKGEFLGGVIMPGAALMRAALNKGTARLPATIGAHEIFPTSTNNAITTGSIEACLGAIERMYKALEAREGAAPQCVASGGGMAALVAALLTPSSTPSLGASFGINVVMRDNLVLDGLIRIALANAQAQSNASSSAAQ